ncbi:putative MFS family arabinose efflux permease [Diaminobutyricimonas aerilata]|uniref:Putative MFS family arabinose efflux permease n=1 Tax=Diaminobutyricimonas aerilata TaxID=1162967 RepID=A0A2M9CI89_9MICO|nr:MFS transporter [Diaminobutyricimonas aerilata]PJJ71607.1 putative MFS family arabinose efflux permease [Diaminobutyricimonas aerilata]
MNALHRTLPPSVAYFLAAGIIGLALFASVTPSPIYHSYGASWHLSPFTLTLVYATYAVGVLVALLLGGSLSDDVGRRPVLLVSLGALLVSTVLYVIASSVGWLFVARGLQGLATGLAVSAASAALLDLHPRRDPWAAGLANGVASTAGIALGIFSAAELVQSGGAPRVLPYLLLLVLFAVAMAGVVWMPHPAAQARGIRVRVARPHVPRAIRGPFLLAALTVIATWSLGGLYFSLGPALGARLFHTTDVVLSSSGIIALAAAASIAQLAFHRTPPWLLAMLGSVALAAGVSLVVIATATGSGTVLLVGSAVGGIGFGIGFLGGLRALVGTIPSHHRASVMSAYYTVAYLALSVPAVVAGLLVGWLGLDTTFEVVGSVVVLVGVATVIVAWRARPAQATGVATNPA